MKIKNILILFLIQTYIAIGLHAEILCAFKISSWNELEAITHNQQSITGNYFKSILKDELSCIDVKYVDKNKNIYGAFITIPDSINARLVLFIPVTSKDILKFIPQIMFSKIIDKNICAISQTGMALEESEAAYTKFNSIFIQNIKDISVICFVRNTWNIYRMMAQVFRGLAIMMYSATPSIQSQLNQLCCNY